MLIGESLINEAFDAWLEKHGFEARIGGLENDFYWSLTSDTITYSFVHTERFIEDFTEVCNGLGLAYDIDIFWLSFFHELGHSMTYHFVDDDDADEAESATGMAYYYCAREFIATEWAVKFINEHIDLVCELMETVRPAIVNFFVKNNIEDGGVPVFPVA